MILYLWSQKLKSIGWRAEILLCFLIVINRHSRCWNSLVAHFSLTPLTVFSLFYRHTLRPLLIHVLYTFFSSAFTRGFFFTYPLYLPHRGFTYPHFFSLPTPKLVLPTPNWFFHLPQNTFYLPQIVFFTYPKRRFTYPKSVFLPTPKQCLPTPIMKYQNFSKKDLILLWCNPDVSVLPDITPRS